MIAVKPVSLALALCWHAGCRLTRLGTSLMRVAAEHGHVPNITDEDAARMAPETDDEAKTRMRADFQDWTSGVRLRGSVQAVRADIGQLEVHLDRGGVTMLDARLLGWGDVPVGARVELRGDRWQIVEDDGRTLAARLTAQGTVIKRRQWLAGQQANPTWVPRDDFMVWMARAWPVFEQKAGDVTTHWTTADLAGGLGPDPLAQGLDDLWRPLILTGMDIDLRDGVIAAADRMPEHFRRVSGWQYKHQDERWFEAKAHEERVDSVRLATHWRPAIWAELDED